MFLSRLRIDHLFGVVVALVIVLVAAGGGTALRLSGLLIDASDDASVWAEADAGVTALISSSLSTQAFIEDGVESQSGSTDTFVEKATMLVVEVSDLGDLVHPFLSLGEAEVLAAHAEDIIESLNSAVIAGNSAINAFDIGDQDAGAQAAARVQSDFAVMRDSFTALHSDFRDFKSSDLEARSAEAESARRTVVGIGTVALAVLALIIFIGLRVRQREKGATLERLENARRLQAYADELDSERALMSAVIETIPFQVSWRDGDLGLQGCNQAFETYFGGDRDIDTPLGRALCELEEEVLRSGEPSLGTEVAGDDGSTFVVTVVPMHDGDAVGVLSVLHDVTDQIAMQRQLQQAQKLESVGQLAAGIAHEINTPMQYIGDNAHFLKATVQRLLGVVDTAEAVLDEDPAAAQEAREQLQARIEKAKLPILRERAPKAAEDALSGVENVSRIVRAMKRFSHPGSDEMAPVDINDALDTTLTVCKNEWKYAADVETEFAEDLPPVVANLGPLNQVWLNLIVNAAHAVADRHGDSKGVIRVVTRRSDEGHIAVDISDNGCGIPEDNLQKVFDHFFTTKAVGKGTGQGLAIAHKVVVDEHGGSIDVTSEVGVGTTFSLTLPIEGPVAAVADDIGEPLAS